MSTDAIAVPMAVDAEPEVHGGLHSPPDSTNTTKPDASDSELSDLEDAEEEDIGDITPDYWADDGRVPVFKPTSHQFKNFLVYMNKINPYGMRSGIVKVIPPEEWKAAQPKLDEQVKTIRVKDPIKQDIMGTNGTYRQANILHQRSYNLPQWRALCEQSDHQPPAKRGEVRRSNVMDKTRASTRARTSTPSTPATAAPPPPGVKRRPGRPRKSVPKTEEVAPNAERLPTPVSPKDDEVHSVKQEPDEQEDAPVRPRGRQPRATTVSARRKNNKRDAVGKIDEAAFKDFDYRMDFSEFTPERCEELERIYWKTLTYASPLYGADMPGTLFDDRTKAWNLGKLENLLDVLGTKIPGVNTAYLYLGMWKATFAWHLEDVDLYSINYNHFGAPKQWYSIAQADARRFENAMKQIFPADAKACDQFLRHKTFLISPTTLLNTYNIRVNRIVHYPGEFVITFPYGYHSGYNLGYNCAEAVNFALDSWLEYGRIAKKCECEQAQDSVWIDVGEIERKLRGEHTPEYYEVTDDEDEEDEEEEEASRTGTPAPANGRSHVIKVKLIHNRKRKREANEKDAKAKVKKVRRVGKVGNQPCSLCPNDTPSEPLLPADNGKQVHRRCGLYIPETDIENVNGIDKVMYMANIAKARLELKCGYCGLKVGACFQCSRKKCARAYHATCAIAAGVFVEEGETSVYAVDGTEYRVPEIQFSCKFHRVKRDRKLTIEDLEKDKVIKEAALRLKKGDLCQFQYLDSKDWIGGVLVENRMDEGMLLIDVLPHGGRFEIEYKWLMLGQPGDYNIIKPSANAVPMPKAERFGTHSKRQNDDLPRPDDKFGDSGIYVWKEFNQCDPPPKNPDQVKVDLSKENQIWYYLGRNSTEARAQFTEDIINKPRHNPKGLFLETIPKPSYTSAVPTPRQSYPASHPSSNSTIAAKTYTQSQTTSNTKEKPYTYKPRIPADVSFTVDPQALLQQRKYVNTAMNGFPTTATHTPHWRSPINHVNSLNNLTHTHFLPPSIRQESQQQQQQQSSATAPAGKTIDYTPFGSRAPYATTPASGSGSGSGHQRSTSAARYSSKPNPFARYAYLQQQHNRSPLEYKTPYNPNGGFMNGYEGNLKKHLQNTPNALAKYTSDLSRQSTTPAAVGNMNYTPNNFASRRPSYPQAPYLAMANPIQASNTNIYGHRPPSHSSSTASASPKYGNYNTFSPLAPSASTANTSWEKRDPNAMHPAIRRDYVYNSQFQATQSPPATQTPHNTQYSRPDLYQYKPQQFQPPMKSESQFQTPKQPIAPMVAPNSYQSSRSPVEATPIRQELHPSIAKHGQYESQIQKPMYPHQQYFQKPQQPAQPLAYSPGLAAPMQSQPAPSFAPMPLQHLAPISQITEEPLAKIAECPPGSVSFRQTLLANLKKAAS